jgi:hypothetical protein
LRVQRFGIKATDAIADDCLRKRRRDTLFIDSEYLLVNNEL